VAALDGLLHQGFAVVVEGVGQAVGQAVSRAGLDGANTATAVRGLDKAGIAQLALYLANDGGHFVLPLRPGDDDGGGHGKARLAEDHLLEGLVHAEGAGGHTGPHVGNAHHLQEPLEGAVLTVGAVHQRKQDIQLVEDGQGPAGEAAARVLLQALSAGRQAGHAFTPDGGQGGLRLAGGEPGALLGDADRHRLEAILIDGGHHPLGGDNGHFMLGGAAAEEDAHQPGPLPSHRIPLPRALPLAPGEGRSVLPPSPGLRPSVP